MRLPCLLLVSCGLLPALCRAACMPPKIAQRCILASHPMFNAECTAWSPKHAEVHNGDLESCDLRAYSPQEAATILNGSVVMFIGDSTARRAALQLKAHLLGTHFEDVAVGPGKHEDMEMRLQLGGAVTDIATMWLPMLAHLQSGVSKAENRVYQRMTTRWWGPIRKVIVLHYSTWDLKRRWGHLADKHFPIIEEDTREWARNVTSTVTSLRTSGILSPDDILLYRLPIAQGCNTLFQKQYCKEGEAGPDPMNDHVHMAVELVRAQMMRHHPDVGLIDAFTWTVGEAGTAGRHKCAPADEKGTHFGTDLARTAYVQQVLHATALLSCAKPAWQ